MSKFSKSKPKPPSKGTTKRRPGQSSEEIREEHISGLFYGSAFIVCSLIFSITHLLFPAGWWVVGLGVAGVGIFMFFKHVYLLKSYSLGLKAERRVGTMLQSMERKGALVLHDLGFDNYNVDHVLIAQSGVYVIETKHISKRGGRNEKLFYKNNALFMGQKPLKSNPVGQAEGGAKNVGDLLGLLGKTPFIRSVVIIPDWYIECEDDSQKRVWVLTEKGFPKWEAKASRRLSQKQVQEIYGLLRLTSEGTGAVKSPF